MKKILLSLIFSVSLFGGIGGIGISEANAQTFRDVPQSSAYYEAAEYLAEKGVIDKTKETFKPFDPINRAEFTKIVLLSKYSSAEISRGLDQDFSDIGSGEWYKPYANFAKENDILSGYQFTPGIFSFGGGRNITKGEASKVVVNTLLKHLWHTWLKNNCVSSEWWCEFTSVIDRINKEISIDLLNNGEKNITRGEMIELIYEIKKSDLEEEALLDSTFKGNLLGSHPDAFFTFQYPSASDGMSNVFVRQDGKIVKIISDERLNGIWTMNIGNNISNNEDLIDFLRPLYGNSCNIKELNGLNENMFDVILERPCDRSNPTCDCALDYLYHIRYTRSFGGNVVSWVLGHEPSFYKNGIPLDPMMVKSFKFSTEDLDPIKEIYTNEAISIKKNINTIITNEVTNPVNGNWYVYNVDFVSPEYAYVDFEDGHYAYKGLLKKNGEENGEWKVEAIIQEESGKTPEQILYGIDSQKNKSIIISITDF